VSQLQTLGHVRAPFTQLLVLLVSVITAVAEPPHIPTTNEVARYEREQPVFHSTLIARDRGDALLALLDGGRSVDRWMKNGFPPGVVCVLPVPPRLWIAIALTNGTIYRIGLSHDGGLLYVPEGLYEVSEATSDQVFKWMAEIEADLRKEVISAPKPCAYKVGTVDDGGTLSGIARIFYGDTSKWKKIYEANRSVLKNPDIITGTETLTIPKL
jgi:hypothetical protein